MNVYLVGGALRDALLNRPIKDKDFVVVGAGADDLLSQGFTQVGADFPVFLHPYTHDEYALARTERKNGNGYQGFAVFTKGVSLEDDLARRDLTINALAMPVLGLFDDTPTGGVIDPYGGQLDLQNKCLRHVSPAFSEDPLRVLRVARFYARFYELGFTVAPDTAMLMKQIARQGELSHLSRERIWTECTKALDEAYGFAFFEILFELDILKHLLPELDAVWQNTQIRQNTFKFLKKAHGKPHHILFALLAHGLLDDADKQKSLFERLLPPNIVIRFTQLLSTHYLELIDIYHLNAEKLLHLIEHTKAQKDDTILFELIETIEIMTDKSISRKYLKTALMLYHAVTIDDINPSLTGKQIGDELKRLRIMKMTHELNHLC